MPPQNTTKVELAKQEAFISNKTLSSNTSVGSRTLSNILEYIGNTPLVKLNRIPASMGIKCQVLVKCEFYGPGGSHKDRIALEMIEDAERSGRLLPGGTIIEPTSGNTGIGIAIVAAVKGYKCIFTMTDKNSQEKVETLAALGAKIIKTPGLPLEDPNSYISLARRLQRETPNSIMLDQYSNPSNPAAHYRHTAVEILEQCQGHVDMLVVGAGTGGAITGLGRRIKESKSRIKINSNCLVVGVDPEGSLLAEPQSLNNTSTKAWEVEGIGHNDFTPANLDKAIIDKWYKSNDFETLEMARRLISEEGLLAGGSSGAVVSCALKAIQDAGLTENDKCVILLPDSIRNYMTKFLTQNWMLEKNLLPDTILNNQHNYSWWDAKVDQLPLNLDMVAVTSKMSVKQATLVLRKTKLREIPVINDDRSLLGIVSLDGILTKMTDLKLDGDQVVSTVMSTKFRKVSSDDSLAKLIHVLQGGNSAVVLGPEKQFVSIVTQHELTDFIFEAEGAQDRDIGAGN